MKFKKLLSVVLSSVVVACSLGVLCSCTKNTEIEKITFKDCSGAEITMSKNIEKVICTDQSCTAFITAFGDASKLIGIHGSQLGDKWSSIFMGSELEHMSKFGYKPSAEAIYKANADLVLISDATYAEELRKSKINAVCFNYTDIDELYFAVDMLGTIFGDNAQAYVNKWKDYVSDTISEITTNLSSLSDVEKKNIYYINASNNPTDLYSTFGGNSFYEYWINTIGANLVTSEYDDITSIEAEKILSKNPQTIIIGGYAEYSRKEELLSDPLWADIEAVKNNDIHLLPTSMADYTKFSVELPMLLKYSAHEIYPSLVAFDGISALRTFYNEFYNVSLSDEYLTNLLNGLYPDGTRKD